ncbi:perilipin-1-like [Penaeus monodon]|uniref:Lipid storage droplet protein n=1 Tax=Penaeus monodon TaxID=6687 RepID=G5DCP6_PENMO|nr:perilipin-1-like [Penaeus monodon]XP_037804124.1 perilipin-1-like [Penaeus monodon]XP_037804125.1 perilipin-1-like [Penaeus monodon]AEP13982.1 lipid storage droplet protein [Penaeus monodon]
MASNTSNATPAAEGFFERVLLLPVLSDAITIVSHAYKITQDRYQYVGTALRVAEAGIRVATEGALPLAMPLLHPLVDRVGGWSTLDEWACRGLDRVEEAAPIITKPTDEIVSSARRRVLSAVAGKDALPPSLSAAVTSRANDTVDVIAASRGGRVVAGAAERVLNTAHTLVDAYLPPREGDLHDTDGRDATVGVKVIALASKTRRRLARALHSLAHPHHAHAHTNADACDATDASGSFLIAFSRECVSGWHSEVTRQPEPHEAVPVVLRIARTSYRYLRNVTENLGSLVVAVRNSLARNAVSEALSGAAANGCYVVSEMQAWGEYFVVVMSMTPSLIEEASLRSRMWAEGCLESVMKMKYTNPHLCWQ